jgi:hypothetical protein
LHAIELLAFVSAQPAAYQYTRAEAQRLVNELADRLAPDVVTAAQQRAQTMSLEEAIALAEAELAA